MAKRNKNDLNHLEITTIVLYLLGGGTRAIHHEDVAIKCFELFPTKFSWTKYPQYPDIKPSLFALEAGRKSVNGNVIEGNTRKGWMLTSKGIEWIDRNQNKVDNILSRVETNQSQRLPTQGRSQGVIRKPEEEIQSLRKTDAYQKYIQGVKEQIDVYDFHRFMRINQYVPSKKYEQRLEEIKLLTEKDENLKELVIFLYRKFKNKYQKPG